jgi:hypothetical protein
MAVDIDKAKQQAHDEFEKEQLEAAKERYKSKLLELKRAEKVVANIKRELEDLDDELRND